MYQSPWHVLHVIANHEKRVAQHLSVRSLEHYVPLYTERSRWTDRSVDLERPLFTGYVFVRFSPESKLSIISTPGVLRLLGNARARQRRCFWWSRRHCDGFPSSLQGCHRTYREPLMRLIAKCALVVDRSRDLNGAEPGRNVEAVSILKRKFRYLPDAGGVRLHVENDATCGANACELGYFRSL